MFLPVVLLAPALVLVAPASCNTDQSQTRHFDWIFKILEGSRKVDLERHDTSCRIDKAREQREEGNQVDEALHCREVSLVQWVVEKDVVQVSRWPDIYREMWKSSSSMALADSESAWMIVFDDTDMFRHRLQALFHIDLSGIQLPRGKRGEDS
ncbi:hypothetical protein SISNIDRAFT_462190 [Sistotremastrum niveocremeum HHB9708]|uniref:Uncharacterized protein n=1 Tax=Sistotremastrum niveocremeum HHB9708 TaxID=1314777 RepID=A0A164ZW29_9AGAM|nr:hypothetical protein SISNIDRAFT_462190 [Sistotremastrum niveocremeum HHB9708]